MAAAPYLGRKWFYILIIHVCRQIVWYPVQKGSTQSHWVVVCLFPHNRSCERHVSHKDVKHILSALSALSNFLYKTSHGRFSLKFVKFLNFVTISKVKVVMYLRAWINFRSDFRYSFCDLSNILPNFIQEIRLVFTVSRKTEYRKSYISYGRV
jgi:hypothetical protein